MTKYQQLQRLIEGFIMEYMNPISEIDKFETEFNEMVPKDKIIAEKVFHEVETIKKILPDFMVWADWLIEQGWKPWETKTIIAAIHNSKVQGLGVNSFEVHFNAKNELGDEDKTINGMYEMRYTEEGQFIINCSLMGTGFPTKYLRNIEEFHDSIFSLIDSLEPEFYNKFSGAL